MRHSALVSVASDNITDINRTILFLGTLQQELPPPGTIWFPLLHGDIVPASALLFGDDSYLSAHRIIGTIDISTPQDSYGTDQNQKQCYYSGAFYNMMIHWLEDGAKESPEDMAEEFLRIANAV